MRRVIVLVTLLAVGCATRGEQGIVRDGVTYGVTEGPFRGRWWNYYERGRSYSDGGYWEQASRDFEKALDERDSDQRWARTYGLHFRAQYFPNREAGIAAFHLEDYSTAVERLQRSHDQTPSARAEYYLRRALEADPAEQSDSTPPEIEAVVETSDSLTAGSSVRIAIQANDDRRVDRIWVNDDLVLFGPPTPSVAVNHLAELVPGSNSITVAVEDLAGNRSETVLAVVSDVDGPLVSIDAHRIAQRFLGGAVYDQSDIAYLTIDGTEVALHRDPNGVSTFQYEIVPSVRPADLKFIAEDSLGNRTEGSLGPAIFHTAANPSALQFASTSRHTHSLRFAVENADSAGPTIRFTNLVDGQRYLGHELVANIEIDAAAGVAGLRVNGVEVTTFPNRDVQRLSRRILLPAEGPNEITAVLSDSTGRTTTERVLIERVLTEVERVDRKLSLAIVGDIWEGPLRGEAIEEQFVADELTRVLFATNRFDLVTRDLLPQVLTEQELQAALGDRNGPSPLSRIVPAELMAVGMVRKDTESIEIILQAISLETSELVGYADVAGPVSSRDDLRRLVGDLALRFLQEFPRVQGRVLELRSRGRLYSSLAAPDRIRRNLKCLIFRKGPELIDPATGIHLGAPVEVLAEGRFNSVKEQFSVVNLEGGSEIADTIEVRDFVVTK